MSTNEQVSSIDHFHINGMVNNDEDEKLSLDSQVRHTRFFRTKRKQRLGENQIELNGDCHREVESTIEKFKGRSTSSPPPPSSSSCEFSAEAVKNNDWNSSSHDEFRPNQQPSQSSPPTILLTSYQRRKSQSLKLTQIDRRDVSPKKVVRFADDFGLDLNHIRMIKVDELPCIPSAAFKHLQISHQEPRERTKVINYVESQFENPMHTYNFNDRLARQKIILEQANTIDNRIYGTVKLFSYGLHKQVKIRVTTDNWQSYRDYEATYMPNSYDGTYDRFSFTLEIERHLICDGNNIQFSICYESFGGPEYWDNNYQENYRFNCLARTIPDYSR